MMRYDAIIKDEGFAGLNPVIFGYESCKKKHSFGPAVRKYYLLHFVVSGFGKYEIADKCYRIGPGEMFVIPPEEETFYEADGKSPWSYIWIGFTSSAVLPVKLRDVVYCPEAVSIFETMKKCENMSGGKSAYLSGKLWELFSLLIENDVHNRDYVEIALDCIHSEYMNDISISQIAERLNLERTYFSTIFKNKMNISPKKYLMKYRMNIAASLLVKSKKSVTVAAFSVGYNDVSTFSKMFKRQFGVSPNEYAKTVKLSRTKSCLV